MRAANNPDHLGLLSDCYETYLAARRLLHKKTITFLVAMDDIHNAVSNGGTLDSRLELMVGLVT